MVVKSEIGLGIQYSRYYFGSLTMKRLGALLMPSISTGFPENVLDNAILLINRYPLDSVVCFANTYPLDSNLSGG